MDERLQQAVQKVFEKYGERIVKLIFDGLLKEEKYSEGKLLQSLTFKIKNTGKIITLQLWAEDYLQWVNAGRKAGKYPPISAILKWVQIKDIRPRGLPRDTRISLKDQYKQSAFQIATSIKRKGIKGIFIVEKVIELISNELTVELENAVATTIGRDIKQSIEEAVKDIKGKYLNVKVNIQETQ